MSLMSSSRRWITRGICLAALGVPMLSGAADYPTRPITIVVGYSPGGANDVLARIVAEKLAVNLGQSVIVENRPGVASIVGASYVAKAKPDGYTLLMGASGPMVFNHVLYAKLPYAPQDFAPITLVGTFPLVMLTQTNNPAKSVAEMVSYAKQNPDKVNYSAPSASFQLIAELFNGKTGSKFQHIPYKGSSDAITAVMTQDVTMTLIDTGPALTALQGGRVKAMAVTSGERLKDLPQVPTMTELGVDINVSFWSGLLAPAGTPAPIVKKIQEEVAKVLDLPDVKKRISGLAITPTSTTPEQFDKLINSEINAWRQVATEKNIKAN